MNRPRMRLARRLTLPGLLVVGLLVFGLPAIAGTGRGATGEDAPLTVFAAASLREAMDEAVAAYRATTGTRVRVSYAASSALARQIEQGAPADVFVPADREWMDWLQQRGLVDPAARVDLLGNTLVLVAPRDAPARPLVLRPGTALGPLLGDDGRIALGLTDSVPAGRYAKAALRSLGLWHQLRTRTAEVENVRAALLLVARGETPLGVVYGSDARAEPRVKVLATFPGDSHPPVVYPAARVQGSGHPQAGAFVRWLRTDPARAIFRRHGFLLP